MNFILGVIHQLMIMNIISCTRYEGKKFCNSNTNSTYLEIQIGPIEFLSIHHIDMFFQHCTSCDIESSPAESKVGWVTVEQCRTACLNGQDCTGFDYGRNSRFCYLNYGNKTTYQRTHHFNGYILKARQG